MGDTPGAQQIPPKGGAPPNLWNVIGLHRPIASFWYQFIFVLAAIGPAMVLFTYLLPTVILPYPSAIGFNSMTVGYFAFLFSIADVATGPAVERFVAQYAEVDPHRAIRYVSFFIWFQAFTGLGQVTGIAIFCFSFLINTNLAYAGWFFLLYSTVQWPGMLASFNYTLSGFQRFDKSNLVSVLQTAVFDTSMQVVFILLGRVIGGANPVIGELMGATIGFIVGKYVSQILAMSLSAFFVSRLLRPFGIKVIDIIRPHFGRAEVKECLQFGMKLLGSTVVSAFTDWIVLVMAVEWLPNYASMLGLIEIAKLIAGVVGLRYNFTALMSESFNNGYKALTKYTITYYFKTWWMFSFFMVLEISMLVPPLLTNFGGDYGAAAPIIPLYIITNMAVTPPSMGSDILTSCNCPWQRTVGLIVEKIVKMIAFFTLLSPWGLVALIGRGYAIQLYILHDLPAYVAITIVEFYYVKKLIVPVRVNWWQTFAAGTLASMPFLPLNLLISWAIDSVRLASPDMLLPLVVAGACLLVALFLFPALLYFFYGLFGGWDDRGLQHFMNAVPITGPSQFVFKFFANATRVGHHHSPWKNRWPIPSAEADKDIAHFIEWQAKAVVNKNA